jgi:hypothetical protein
MQLLLDLEQAWLRARRGRAPPQFPRGDSYWHSDRRFCDFGLFARQGLGHGGPERCGALGSVPRRRDSRRANASVETPLVLI